MNRLQPTLWLALAIAAGASQLSAQNAVTRPGNETVVVLITEQEAALSPGKKRPVAMAANSTVEDRAITRGPKIFFVSPSDAVTVPLIHFELKFLAFNGAQIDPKMVKLTYLKQSPVDLTPRVAAFIRSEGIDVPHARVAPGRHQIQIDVVDTEGRQASKLVTLDVAQ
jgi:hypothetical protein